MVGMISKQPARGWLVVLRWVVLTTLFTTLLSVAVTAAALIIFRGRIDTVAMATAFGLPMVLTPPIVGFFARRQQKLRELNARLNDLAYRDYLLGCLNRRAFTESANAILHRASKQQPCALLVIDADNFKVVNDRFGHEHGDAALLAIMDAIRRALRDTDIIGRLGGEEFGILLTRAEPENLAVVAERIRLAVSAVEFTPLGTRHRLSVSIGGAMAVTRTDFARLFSQADARLYDAKNQGRNKVEVPDYERLDYSRKIA
jgi:diguanylate cyclase